MINQNHLLLFVIVSSIYAFQAANAGGCFLSTEYHVYVANELPPWSSPLRLHCAGKDDDHGTISLTVGQQFPFWFCDNNFSTLYFCRFWWNDKSKAFVVYDSTWRDARCGNDGVCYYAVKEDGFYISDTNPPKREKLVATW